MKPGPGVLYTLVICALICFFIFSDKPFEPEEPRLHRRHMAGVRQRSMKVKHEPLAFDPLVAEMDRRREDRTWERSMAKDYRTWANRAQQWMSHPNYEDQSRPQQQYAIPPATAAESQPSPWDDISYAEGYAGEDYLNSENFNITHRLEVLFPFIDVNPHDNLVSLKELEHWEEQSALKVTHQRTDRDLVIHDLNKDGLISFSEYVPHVTAKDLAENDLEVGGAGWWNEQFQNADEDGDGVLNRTEFHEFLHPEDSRVEKIHRWLIRQELRARSAREGWNLTWSDFHQNVFDVIRDYGKEEAAPELAHLNPYRDMEARKQILSRAAFQGLDTNKDEYLTEDEVEPIIGQLRPGELYYAKIQAQQLMDQADDDHDGHLSLDEMLTHPYVFYNTAYDHGDDDNYHDEF